MKKKIVNYILCLFISASAYFGFVMEIEPLKNLALFYSYFVSVMFIPVLIHKGLSWDDIEKLKDMNYTPIASLVFCFFMCVILAINEHYFLAGVFLFGAIVRISLIDRIKELNK